MFSSASLPAHLLARSSRVFPRVIPANARGRLARFNSTLADIEASKVEVRVTSSPKTPPDTDAIPFGHSFTDHMLTIPWNAATGWGAPQIQPYGPFTMMPSSSVFHYATCLFEGLKAYRNDLGKVTLFRPDMNMKRMNISAQRAALPNFDGDAVIELIKQLVRLDKHWIPNRPGYSLYIRPTLIGSQPAIGIHPSTEALLFVICTPAGPYFPQGFKPVALIPPTSLDPGTGAYKLGANYVSGLAAQSKAYKEGYVQNLWLHGPEHYVTEVGTMNAFATLKRPDGALELVTPPLDGMILAGITRDSVLSLARDHASGKSKMDGLPERLIVTERSFTMSEVKQAAQEGNLVEFFGTGTAATISSVDRIGYLGEDVHIPTGPDGMGPVARAVFQHLAGIQRGVVSHPWSVVVSE
ncbi:uncharacterized protein FIBRA_04914 [Fibroporia radiculosa]|uniref:Branched-chain-amino-acid aminotransferase n=1 Tax=Fibroporia radiculosa TaxID=599839 RepID=J4G859_9APHY|nr:uncharacterized protein FIBRA_04914 [Fibroporia radiculosa]CCM02803.1 predicted protein [Fibroporia radiculosa]